MSGNGIVNRIKQNSQTAKKLIDYLKAELSDLNTNYNNIIVHQLKEENKQLRTAVEAAKKNLTEIEAKNGIKQIEIPNTNITILPEPTVNSTVVQPQNQSEEIKPKKENKKLPKTAKPSTEKKKDTVEIPVDVGQLDLRIGKIEDVQKHPDADLLYVLKINCGEDTPRTVCSGLVKYVSIDELKDRIVMVLCNLKPATMRGIKSEAMVMCASSDEGVEVLIPPADSQPGDLVYCDGYERNPEPVMNPKKKIFERIAPDLSTNDVLQACYKNIPLMVKEKGAIIAKTLKNVPVK